MSNKCKDEEHPVIWINLLNHGTMEEIGIAVYKALMSREAECCYLEDGKTRLIHRHIEVTGS